MLPREKVITEIESDKAALTAELEVIAEHCASFPVLDDRPADEILEFDEYQIPR